MIALSIVIPVYNEKETLPYLYQRLNNILPDIRKELHGKDPGWGDPGVEVLFIDDGSTDGSREILNTFVRNNNAYRCIGLSRNFGHQAAVSAGIYYARGNAVVIMDADLQDPPELIKDMVIKWKQGFDVVYAVKRKREASFFKNIAYKLYYKINALASDYSIQRDSGDFSLLDKKVVDIINGLPEKEKYIRGLRAWVGFNQTDLIYERPKRKKGESKYSFLSLSKLAFRGIISTSIKPLFISGLFCAFSILIILGIILFVVLSKVFIKVELIPQGWTSLMVTISVLSGFQLVSIWLLSLYIARIYRETLSRPTYLIAYDSLERNEKNEGV